MVTARYTSSFINLQKRTTRALAKFCVDHRCEHRDLPKVNECLAALEAGETERAYLAFKGVPMGGTGHFSDWSPAPAFPQEEPQQLKVIFDALTHYWTFTMHLTKSHA